MVSVAYVPLQFTDYLKGIIITSHTNIRVRWWGNLANNIPSQWKEVVVQKTSPEALKLSARNTELTKSNKHHHHLGPGGYYAKEEQFRKMDEEAAAAGNIDVKNLKVR